MACLWIPRCINIKINTCSRTLIEHLVLILKLSKDIQNLMLGYRLHQGAITNLFKAVKVKLNNMGVALDEYGTLG